MTPPAILAAAAKRGLDLIGAVDHNACGNAGAMLAAAAALRGDDAPQVAVLPGMEIESSEGVHVLCLCDSSEQAAAMQAVVWDHLAPLPHHSEVLGEQWMVDAGGTPLAQETRLLLQSTRMKLDDICHEARRRGLLAVPSHVTRRGYGLLGVLGFVPPGLEIDALELGPVGIPLGQRASADLARYPQILSSDAHRPEEIGAVYTDFWVAAPTVAELRMALQQRDGRYVAAPTPEAG